MTPAFYPPFVAVTAFAGAVPGRRPGGPDTADFPVPDRPRTEAAGYGLVRLLDNIGTPDVEETFTGRLALVKASGALDASDVC